MDELRARVRLIHAPGVDSIPSARNNRQDGHDGQDNGTPPGLFWGLPDSAVAYPKSFDSQATAFEIGSNECGAICVYLRLFISVYLRYRFSLDAGLIRRSSHRPYCDMIVLPTK